jgi:hypothetical protein
MARALKKPAELRDSWRPRLGPDRQGRWLRIGRKLGMLLVCALLFTAMYFVVFSPFWHPHTHLITAGVAAFRDPVTAPVDFAGENATALQAPLDAVVFRTSALDRSPRILATADDFTSLAARLSADVVRPDDVLVLYLQTHGVGIDGEAYLLAGDYSVVTGSGRYPLKSLVDILRQSPAQTKLLVLDAGRLDFDPRAGLIVNEFPKLLQEAIEATNDPNLWVLSDCAPLERGHTATSVRQTIFGHYAARALQGEADANADLVVDIGELFRFVQANVAEWVGVSTGGFARQTPMLLCGRPLVQTPAKYPVLLSVSTLVKPKTTDEKPGEDKKDEPKPAEPAVAAAPPPPTPAPSASPTGTATPAAATTTAAAKPTGTATPPDPNAPVDPNAAPVVKLPDPSLVPAPLPAPIQPLVVDVPTAETKSPALVELGRAMQAAIEDRSRGAATPLDFGPHWWRAAKADFAALERMQADPNADPRVVETSLRRAVTALGDFAAGRSLEAGDEALRKLTELRTSFAPPPEELRDWALVERAALEGASTPPEDLTALMNSLDAAFAAETSKAFDELAAKPWPAIAERYEEFHFARRLARTGELSWIPRRLAWRTCREGERAGAEDHKPNELAEADRLREAARRELFDQVDGDWNSAADRAFRSALELYRTAQRAADERRRSLTLRNDSLFRAAAYLRWYHDGAGDTACTPRYEDLASFFAQLAEFDTLLERGPDASYDELAPRRERLAELKAALEAPLGQAAVDPLIRPDARGPALRHRIEVLLRSGLASPAVRMRLEEALTHSETDQASFTALAVLPPSQEFVRAPSKPEWTAAKRLGLLTTSLAGFAYASLPEPTAIPVTPFDELLKLAMTQLRFDNDLTSKDEAASWSEFRIAGQAAHAVFADLPRHLDMVAQLGANLSDPATRPKRLDALRAAERARYLLDPRDVGRLAQEDVSRILNRAAWYDVLVENRSRVLLARDDASNAEAAYLAAIAEDDRELAQKYPNQPVIAARPLDPIKLSGPTELSLTDEPSRDLTAVVDYIGPTAGPVWIVVHYDPELFDVRLPPGSGVYEQHKLETEIAKLATDAAAARMKLASEQFYNESIEAATRKALTIRDAGRFPLNPQLAGLPATWSLNPGERKDVVVQLRRKGTAARKTKVVVKAITGATHLRTETATTLPSLETISFAPVGGSGSWSRTADGVILHPLPNRTTDYEFQVANLGTAEKTVDIEFLAPEKRIETMLPNSVQTLAISEVLALTGPGATLVKIEDLKLPGGGKPVSLVAPPPKEKGAPPPKEEDKNKQESTVGTGPKTGDELPPQPVRQGMLMILRERATGNTLLRRIDFRPQRPRRYVDASVGYNLAQERIEVRIVASDRAAVPAAGVKVKLNFPEPLARGTEAQLEGILNAPDYSALLYVQAPPSDSRVQTVYIDVDDYPRAFIYRVPCGPPATNIPEVADALDLRILAPATGSMFQAPAAKIPVSLEVDAPVGSFDNERDTLEVGIDRDRDRDFRDEAPLVLHSDRQAEIFMNKWGTNGIVNFKTDVHDFKLEVPGGALQNLRANLIAKAQVGSRIAYSAPVDIGLDGAPPQISRVELKPGRTVQVKGELIVDVWSTDAEMSGTGKVEIGFDKDGSGKFSEKEPPLPAVSVAPTRWSLKMPTDALVPGRATLLIRATDRVGNVGEISKMQLTVVSAADAAALAKAAGSRVTGTVRYGPDPLEKATVALLGPDDKPIVDATTDAAGFFALEAVPAGTYKLAARGLARNKPRKLEQALTVPPPPAKVPRLDLKVE